jgi:SAM-dependent methyltransferase
MTSPADFQQHYVTACPVGCAVPFATTDVVLPEGPLVRCTECGQLVSQCTETQYIRSLETFDTSTGTFPGAESVRRHEKVSARRLRKVLELLGKPPHEARLLDVGCSSGAFLLTARKLGLNTTGVEPSAEAAETARRAGLNVFTGFLDGARFSDASFDAATLIEVIEHLRDPRSLLVECRRVLKPGGILLVTTPNAASWTARLMGSRWDGFSLTAMGGHVSFFNPRSIRMIAERTGFELVRVETRNVRFFERGQCPVPIYRAAKIVSELLNWPAQLFGQGHDMYAYLRARKP